MAIENCFRGQAPDAWDPLLEFTTDRMALVAAGDTEGLIRQVIKPMHQEVSSLEDEHRERLYYYSLGTVMQVMKPELEDPDVLEGITDEVAGLVVKHHFTMGAGKSDPSADLTFESLDSWSATLPIRQLALRANNSGSQALSTMRDIVAVTVGHNRQSPGSDLMPHHIERVLSNNVIAGAIGANAFGTTILLIQKSLGYGGGWLSNRCPVASGQDDGAKDRLAGLQLQKVALQMGTLRADEFNDPVLRDRLLSLGNNGLVYHQDRLPEKPITPLRPKDERAPFRHEERLHCPAVAAQLIPFVVKAVPQIALKAHQEVKQRRGF